jgi:hypothetical protein
MNHLDTRSGDGYHLRGIAVHEVLRAPRRGLHHEPETYGGMTLLSAALLMAAGVAAVLAAVDVLGRIYPF